MKKGGVIILLVISLFIIKFGAAAYTCSDNSTIREDVGEIDTGKRSIINGLSLGLTNADEAFATGKVFVDLVIDGRVINLTNSSSSKVINFTSGSSYTIQLVNATDLYANIKVASSATTFIEKEELLTINGIKVFLSKTQGYPKEERVDILAGVDGISLDNFKNKEKIVKLNNFEYLVDLFSSSDEDTLIRVRRCDNFSAKLIQTSDNLSIAQNTTLEQNNSNDSLNNSETNTTNETQNPQNNGSSFYQQENQERKAWGIGYEYLIVGIILAIILFILGSMYLKNKRSEIPIEQNSTEQDSSY